MSRWGRGFFLLIGWTATAALAVVLALYVAVSVAFHHDETPPDVAGIARSQPVADADHLAASATSASLKVVAPPAASWLAPGPTTVSDFCESTQGDEFGAGWNPTTCTRTVTAYFFFNGSFPQHLQAWDTALRASGWSGFGDPLSETLSDYARISHKPGPGEPGPTYLATSLPRSGLYVRTDEGSPTSGQAVDLTFLWAERPQTTPSVADVDGSPVPGAFTAVAWIQKPAATASPDAVESAAFAHYQFVAVATLTDRYYNAAVPTPTPSASHAVSGCMTGSKSCN